MKIRCIILSLFMLTALLPGKLFAKVLETEYILKYGETDLIHFSKDAKEMLEVHSFYTHYRKELLNEKRENNMITLQMKILETEKHERKHNGNQCKSSM